MPIIEGDFNSNDFFQPYYQEVPFGAVLAGVFRANTLESSRKIHPGTLVTAVKARFHIPVLPDLPFTAVLGTDRERRTTLDVYSGEESGFIAGDLGWEKPGSENLVSALASRFNKLREEVIEGVDDWRYGVTVLEQVNNSGKNPIWPDISLGAITYEYVYDEVKVLTRAYLKKLSQVFENDPKRMGGILYFVPGRDRLIAGEFEVAEAAV